MSNVQTPAEDAPRRFNRVGVIIAGSMIACVLVAIFATLQIVDGLRDREVKNWEIRLGIAADTRVADLNHWINQGFGAIGELAENASLQLYLSELQSDGAEPTAEQEASATYLRNLLIAQSERRGFAVPNELDEIAANVERPGIAGIALVDKTGNTLSVTPDMPPFNPQINAAIAQALAGAPAIIDVYPGSSRQPTVGFVLPVYGIQDDRSAGIGAVVGVRLLDDDFYGLLRQPGDQSETGEIYLLRRQDQTIDFISPLMDGTKPFEKKVSFSSEGLLSSSAIANPGNAFSDLVDHSGVPVLAVTRNIASFPWVLVSSISRDEALASTEDVLQITLFTSITVIVAIALGVVAVWRHGSSVRTGQAMAEMSVALDRFENMSKFMRVVTDNQPTQIIAVDADTKYTFANETVALASGIPKEEIIGRTMAGVMSPRHARKIEEINKPIFETFEPEAHLLRLRNDDVEDETAPDAYQVYRTKHVPLRGDRDYPPGVLVILDDVTDLTLERYRSERRLRQLIDTLVSVVDRRDPFSAFHSIRVSEVGIAIAKEMGLTDQEVLTIDVASRLMNLGKIYLPIELLTKTGDLTADERQTMMELNETSAELLSHVEFDGPVIETIHQVNERYDGGGPLGTVGDQTLVTARVISVANAFVGMVSARAWRDALPFRRACEILMDDAGTRYDHRPISALMNCIENRKKAEEWAHYRDAPAA